MFDVIMTLTKPNSVYVIVRDGATGRSKSKTVYGSTHEQVIEQIERAIGPQPTIPNGDGEARVSGHLEGTRPQPPVVGDTRTGQSAVEAS
jgi:hypothetical protein